MVSGCHAEINDSSVGGSLDFCVLNTSCRHVPLLLGCSGWKPQLCFSWFEGFPTRLVLSVFFCLSTGMQSVQGSCLKNLSVSSGTAFFLLWNEKDKVSKLPTNQNQHKEWQKKWLKSEDLFVFSVFWLTCLPDWIICCSILCFSFRKKEKKMLSSFSPVPVFGNRASKLSKQASKRT